MRQDVSTSVKCEKVVLFITIHVRDNFGFWKYYLNFFQRNALNSQGCSNATALKAPATKGVSPQGVSIYNAWTTGEQNTPKCIYAPFLSTLHRRYLMMCHIHRFNISTFLSPLQCIWSIIQVVYLSMF